MIALRITTTTTTIPIIQNFYLCIDCRGQATREQLIPAIESLVDDPESVIRQHLAAQLLEIAIVAMVQPNSGYSKVQDLIDNPSIPRLYDANGYAIVCERIVTYLNELIADSDLDVRRAAATAFAGLAQQLEPEDVPALCLPTPLRLVYQKPAGPPSSSGKKSKMSEADQRLEELRITSANLLAELGGAASENPILHEEAHWVSAQVLPAILELTEDPSFRVRRAGVQALPRILAACTFEDICDKIVPAFERLSQDGVYRIRKSTGECLVDMSRAMMILAARLLQQDGPENGGHGDVSDEDRRRAQTLQELRRTRLVPVADRLIQDNHKMVRQGMMQFLGPFIASFYPYQYSALNTILPTSTESDGSNHMGIAAQFFPHATSMVSRLNSSQNSIALAPTPTHSSLEQLSPKELSNVSKLKKALPIFLQAGRMSAVSLAAVVAHRRVHPPDPQDLRVIFDQLLDYFAALAIVTTGDENTDAEMRVYCAYSLPAVVLLLGEENWEGPLKTCFFSLLNGNYGKEPQDQQDEDDEGTGEPPLPVKRCLASSLHTMAHVLSPKTAFADVFPVFQEYFLRDSDESVRLNVIRNFPSLLEIVPPDKRREPLLVWSEVVRGDEFLGARKRSASNPLVLNWRQRDYLARSLPDLIGLVDPVMVHDHLWPILQILLTDTVCTVRDDAIWSVAILFKVYCKDTVRSKWPKAVSGAKEFCAQNCAEVVTWLKENILRQSSDPSARQVNNFNDRQLYCRICASLGLALRFSEDINEQELDTEDPVSVLSDKLRTLRDREKPSEELLDGPYQRLTSAEVKHLKKVLVDDLLPPALEMKEDRISNVRVTLMKVLQIMPEDIKTSAACKPVLQNLTEETETWESFGQEPEVPLPAPAPAPPPPPPRKAARVKTMARGSMDATTDSGPVDIDDVSLTPDSSRDEEDIVKDLPNISTDNDESGSSDDSDDHGPPEPMSPRSPSAEDLKTVIFEEGPIGMQLEPTVDDRACRVFSFLDTGPDSPSPARVSGMIDVGDVILQVNGVSVQSYDETISILKAGGRREIVFRPGRPGDTYDDYADEDGEGGAASSDDEAEDGEKEKKKKEKKAKKDSKKSEKKEKKKKEKKAKKEKKHDKDKHKN